MSRADVEWLLATHENGHGPVDWSDENQRKRIGIDLRGADLCEVDLSNLPLACLCAGLTWEEWLNTTEGQRQMASVLMERADLRRAHLEGANLRWSQMKGAYLNEAYMKHACFSGAQMESISLYKAQLEAVDFYKTHLEGASIYKAILGRANLTGAYLHEADLTKVMLGDDMSIGPRLVDVQWGNAILSTVQWSQVKMLEDEYIARHKKQNGAEKDINKLIEDLEKAVRANRQLASALQNQGLNEVATYFAYHAQVLQKRSLRFQMAQYAIAVRERLKILGAWLFSWFLFLLAGYGYRPGRSIMAYLVIIFGFASAYYVFGHLPPFPDALVFSLMSFHGRGFFPSLSGETNLHNPLVILAAIEAVIGLFIEISFIATFTKRFLGS